MMYVSYPHSTKNTQHTEDKVAYCQVAKTLHAWIHQQEEAQIDSESSGEMVEAPTPLSVKGTGAFYMRSSLTCRGTCCERANGMVYYAERQSFLFSNNFGYAWFLFSNDFGYACLDRMLGHTTTSRISTVGPSGVFKFLLLSSWKTPKLMILYLPPQRT
jgi:hypothetical protein